MYSEDGVERYFSYFKQFGCHNEFPCEHVRFFLVSTSMLNPKRQP